MIIYYYALIMKNSDYYMSIHLKVEANNNIWGGQ